MSEDITKLPRWAQNRINQLTRNLELAEQRIDASLTEARPGQPAYGDYGDEHYGKGLPCRQVTWPDIGINIRMQDNELVVHSTGHGRLVVAPSASNAVYLRVLPR